MGPRCQAGLSYTRCRPGSLNKAGIKSGHIFQTKKRFHSHYMMQTHDPVYLLFHAPISNDSFDRIGILVKITEQTSQEFSLGSIALPNPKLFKRLFNF